MTNSEIIFFSFAVKTPNAWIYFQTFRNFLCVSFYRCGPRTFSLPVSLVELKQPLYLAS